MRLPIKSGIAHFFYKIQKDLQAKGINDEDLCLWMIITTSLPEVMSEDTKEGNFELW